MQIDTRYHEDFAILYLRGELDTSQCARLAGELTFLRDAGLRRVALDLRKLRFVNSTALGMIVQASNLLAEVGGRLVIARPSPFCREIMDRIKLHHLVPICDSHEEARRRLFVEPEEPASESLPRLDEDTTILFAPADPSRVDRILPAERRAPDWNPVHRHRFGTHWCGVGRMTELDPDGVRFLWRGGETHLTPFEMGELLAVGTDLRVKFRMPLYRKEHCQAVVTVRAIEERMDGIQLTAAFSRIDPEERLAIRRYTEDLEFLRQELGGEGGASG